MKREASSIGKLAIISLVAVSIISLVIVSYFVFIGGAFAESENTTDRSLQLVNELRVQNHVKSLKWNKQLEAAAQEKVNDIIAKKYFQHTSPTGEKAWDIVLDEGYSYIYAGENLAIDYDTVDEAMEAWKESPSHYANIVSEKYSDYGFAQGEGNVEGHNAKVYVQIFATRESAVKQFVSYGEVY